MNRPNYQQDSDTFDQVNAPRSYRSQLELEQRVRDIVEDKELLACVLKAAAQILETMAPEERDPVEETERAHSPPPVSPPRVESQTSQPYHHSPDPSPRRHHHPPQFPPQGKGNMTEEAMEQKTSAHETSEQTTPRPLPGDYPTICRSPIEEFSTVVPTASETAIGQPTPEKTVSGKPKTERPRSRQPIPGQAIPGLFTPDQPTTASFSQGQSTPGHYAIYHPAPGHWSPYHPPPGRYTTYGQYTTYQGPYAQYPIGHPTPNRYSARGPPRNHATPAPQPLPSRETEQEREARELAEYIAHGHDEELKQKYPEHFMRRRADGRWESRRG